VAVGVVACTMLIAACGDESSSKPFPTTVRVSTTVGNANGSEAPEILSFVATQTDVQSGDRVELTWEVDDPGANLLIDGGVGPVFGSKKSVVVDETTTFTLYASNVNGTQSATVTINVAGSTGSTGPTDSAATGDSTVPVETEVGDEWVSAVDNLLGLPSVCGNLSVVSADPNFDGVNVGIAGQGLWTSWPELDWVQIGQGGGSDPINGQLTDIVYDPENFDRFWMAGIYDGGIYRTVDKGLSIERLGDVQRVDRIAIDFSDPARNTMLTGAHESSVLYKSENSGRSWFEITNTLPPNAGYSASPMVLDKDTYLLGTNNGTESGVLRTTDGGFTWTRVYDVGVSGSPLRTFDGRSIYWMLELGAGVIKSTDDGETWTLASDQEFDRSPGSLIQLPDGRLAALGTTHVMVSDESGAVWNTIGPALPYDAVGVAYAAFRQKFYVWRFDCNPGTNNPILEDSIMTLEAKVQR
jgi:hypothetical protein